MNETISRHNQTSFLLHFGKKTGKQTFYCIFLNLHSKE